MRISRVRRALAGLAILCMLLGGAGSVQAASDNSNAGGNGKAVAGANSNAGGTSNGAANNNAGSNGNGVAGANSNAGGNGNGNGNLGANSTTSTSSSSGSGNGSNGNGNGNGNGKNSSGSPIAASQLSASAPTAASAQIGSAGGTVVAGNLGVSLPAEALAGKSVTVNVAPRPANVPVPGGSMQFSPNGTIADVGIKDAAGQPVTTFPAPISLVFRYNDADLAQANGRPDTLRAAYLIDANSPAIENPLKFPIGTWVLFPDSSTTLDTTRGLLAVRTQALGSVVSVVTNPVSYVQTLTARAELYSNFDPTLSITFGTKSQFSYLRVLEPQVGGRLFVLDPDTGAYAYVNAGDVGPSAPPAPSGSATAVVRSLLSGAPA
ncbi:MAG TPA: hypothetical protein VF157_03810 [Chloroflexota bacterium]